MAISRNHAVVSEAAPEADIANQSQNSSLLSQDVTLASSLNSPESHYQLTGVGL